MNSGTITTTNSTDLLFGGGASAIFVRPGTGYTERSMFEGNLTEDEVVSATGTYSATASNWGRAAWAMQLVAFKGGAASETAGGNLMSSLARTGSAGGAVTSTSQPPDGGTGTGGTASSLHCSPGTITAGGAVTCELLIPASAQSVGVPLTSSSGQVLIPAVVTTRPNQSSLTFQAETSPDSKQQPVTITAALDTGEV